MFFLDWSWTIDVRVLDKAYIAKEKSDSLDLKLDFRKRRGGR